MPYDNLTYTPNGVPWETTDVLHVDPQRWLRRFTFDVNDGTHGPGSWLQAMNRALDGEGARWADSHPQIKKVLAGESLFPDGPGAGGAFDSGILGVLIHPYDEITARDVAFFGREFIKRFRPVAAIVEEEELANLAQKADESLERYYRRAEDLLHLLDSHDRNGTQHTERQEKVLFDVTESYVNGLRDPVLKTRVRNGSLPPLKGSAYGRSLFGVHIATEAAAHRIRSLGDAK